MNTQEFEISFASILVSMNNLVEEGILLQDEDIATLLAKKEALRDKVSQIPMSYHIPFIPVLGSMSIEDQLVLYTGYPHGSKIKSSDFFQFNGFLHNEGNFQTASANAKEIGFMVGVEYINFDALYLRLPKETLLNDTARGLRNRIPKGYFPLHHKEALAIGFQCRENLNGTSGFNHMLCLGSDWDGFEFARIYAKAHGRMEIFLTKAEDAFGKELVVPVCQGFL